MKIHDPFRVIDWRVTVPEETPLPGDTGKHRGRDSVRRRRKGFRFTVVSRYDRYGSFKPVSRRDQDLSTSMSSHVCKALSGQCPVTPLTLTLTQATRSGNSFS